MTPKEGLQQAGQGMIATEAHALWALKNEAELKSLTRDMLVGASIHHDNDANRQKISAYGEFVAHMDNLIKEGRRIIKARTSNQTKPQQ